MRCFTVSNVDAGGDEVKNTIKNAWLFSDELEKFSPWDFGFNLKLFCRSLELTAQALASKEAVSEDAERNAADVREFLRLMNRYENALEFAIAETQSTVGDIPWFNGNLTDEQKEEVSKVSALADEIEEAAWRDAMDLLKERMRHWWD